MSTSEHGDGEPQSIASDQTQKAARNGPALFEWGAKTFVMGVLNVTPDSFSDGGLYAQADRAIAFVRLTQALGGGWSISDYDLPPVASSPANSDRTAQ